MYLKSQKINRSATPEEYNSVLNKRKYKKNISGKILKLYLQYPHKTHGGMTININMVCTGVCS